MTATLTERVAQFFHEYCATLNDGRYDEWPAHFDASDSRYEILSRENYDQGLPVPLMGCYSHGMIIDRVTMLVKKTLTVRRMYFRTMVSNVRATRTDNVEIIGYANILVLQSTLEGVTSIYATGRYETHLIERGDGFVIRSKKVILDSFGIDNMLAVPL